MGSEKAREREKEKKRLEALQNAERRFLNGMYGDFFGNRDEKAGTTGADPGALTFGAGEGREEADSTAPEKEKGKSAQAAGGQAGTGGAAAGRREGAKAPGGLEEAESTIDALAKRGEEIVSAMSSRKDALRRANDALREVQSLLDNPLYDGMPALNGSGKTKSGRGSAADGAGELDPGLMAGSDGDLFSGITGQGKDPGQENPALSAPAVSGPGEGLQQESAAGGAGPSDASEQEPETDPMEELDKLIGLTKIKHDVRELTDFVKIQKMRKDGGLKSVPVSLHLVFTGNPGTGKTTVARILSKLYRQIGVLSKGQLVEVDRSGLVAGYVGQTALKTAQKIGEAKGGVLFIDEAYALARKDDTFGQEAIDTILKAMEDNREDLVVIVAGYTGPMETFINSNPGLKSRFNKYIEFPDYTIDELMGIFDMNCKKYDYEAQEDVRAQVRAMLVQRKLSTQENFANAREVRNLFEEIITNQARRIAAMEAPTQEDMKKILLEDLTETAEEDAAKTLAKAAAVEQENAPETPGEADTEAGPVENRSKEITETAPAANGSEASAGSGSV